jgi:hypothetical protein
MTRCSINFSRGGEVALVLSLGCRFCRASLEAFHAGSEDLLDEEVEK